MKALIIEDEPMARANLERLLAANFPEIEVVGEISSVKAAVAWFRESGGVGDGGIDGVVGGGVAGKAGWKAAGKADIVFMDVELSDGNCFEIFRQTEVRGNVIMTTAYDNYAVKAFEVNSVDYLLKPIDAEALRRAVNRALANVRRGAAEGIGFDVEKLAGALARSVGDGAAKYRQRFIVKFNDKIIPVETASVAYFYSEEKNTFLMTVQGVGYVLDQSLDEVCGQLDPKGFFRVSRRCIVAMESICSITKQLGGRLALEVTPPASFEITVSRSRVDDFLKWIEK